MREHPTAVRLHPLLFAAGPNEEPGGVYGRIALEKQQSGLAWNKTPARSITCHGRRAALGQPQVPASRGRSRLRPLMPRVFALPSFAHRCRVSIRTEIRSRPCFASLRAQCGVLRCGGTKISNAMVVDDEGMTLYTFDAAQPGPRVMSPASAEPSQALRAKMELEWTPQMMDVLCLRRPKIQPLQRARLPLERPALIRTKVTLVVPTGIVDNLEADVERSKLAEPCRSSSDRTMLGLSGNTRGHIAAVRTNVAPPSAQEANWPETFDARSPVAGPPNALVRHGLSRCAPPHRSVCGENTHRFFCSEYSANDCLYSVHLFLRGASYAAGMA